MEDEESDVNVDDLILTDKEKKLIRKKNREEKKRQKELSEDDNPEYHRLKKKLDDIPSVYKRDDKSDVQERITEEQIEQSLQSSQQQIINFTGQVPQAQNNRIPDLVKPKQSHEAGRVIQNQVSAPPMDESGDVDLNKLFSSEVGNESDVVKELFTQENIKVKTELSKDEISIISRLELQASMTQNFFLTKVLKELEILRVSKDRKSRSEFVQSFSGIKEAQSGVTAFGKLGNIFKNDKV